MTLSSRIRKGAAAAGVIAALFALSACSGTSTTEPAAEGDGLQTLTPGKLTIATGEPAYYPWVIDNAPETGEGFEAAVALAVAEELGYAPEDVEWVRTTFDSAVAPGPKDFDLNLQQFTISEERKNAVDFSSPYYTTTQAIITTEGSSVADAASIADFADAKVGVAAASTSYSVAKDALGKDPEVFNSNEDTVLALKSGQIDALVTDLPTAFYLTGVELEDGKIIGQFDSTEGGDEFGIVLPKDSALTAPVTAAVDALRDNGRLGELETEWLETSVDVPTLK